MLVLGLDPGVQGAFALLGDDGVILPDDLPVHLAQHGQRAIKRHELDLHSLRLVLQQHVITHAYVERVTARPGQGVTGVFRFGEAFGLLTGLLVGLSVPLTFIAPKIWQRAHGVGPSPDAARQRAVQLYPQVALQLARKRDCNRADALLIADYSRRQLLAGCAVK